MTVMALPIQHYLQNLVVALQILLLQMHYLQQMAVDQMNSSDIINVGGLINGN
jgi:hypothetical protein